MGGHRIRTARLIATAATVSFLLAVLAPVPARAGAPAHRVTPVVKLSAVGQIAAQHVTARLDTPMAPSAGSDEHIDVRGATSTSISSWISTQRTADSALPRGPPAHRS
jgi:hypothetical protein